MATATDTFTGTAGTDLAAHTADTGQTWTNVDGVNIFLDGANGVYTYSAPGLYTISFTPSTADYDVTCAFEDLGGGTPAYTQGLVARFDESNNYYLLSYHNGAFAIQKTIAGTVTTIGSPAYYSTAATTVTFSMRGSSITASIGGTVVLTATDTDLTAAGKAGIYFYDTSTNTQTTGIHLGKAGSPFTVSDAVGGGGTLTVSAPSLTQNGAFALGVAASVSGGTSPISYQWQTSPDNSTWTTTSATGISTTLTVTPSETVHIRFIATDSSGTPQVATSDSITANTLAFVYADDQHISYPFGESYPDPAIAHAICLNSSGGDILTILKSTGTINALFNCDPTSTALVAQPHQMRASVDKEPYSTSSMLVGPGPQRLPLLTAGTVADHFVILELSLCAGGDGANLGGASGSPRDALIFLGFEVDHGSGATAAYYPARRSGNDGLSTGSSTWDAGGTIGQQSYGHVVMYGLGCDGGHLGLTGAGWGAGDGFTGPAQRLLYHEVGATPIARDLTGCKYFILGGGRNDGADITSTIATNVAALHAAAPTIPVVLAIEPGKGGGYPINQVAYTSEVAYYTANHDSDPLLFLYTPDDRLADGLNYLIDGQNAGGSDNLAYSFAQNNPHFFTQRAAEAGAAAAVGIAKLLAGSSGTYTAAANVRSGTDRGDGTIGTLVVPPAATVLLTETFDNGTTGTVALPSAGQVEAGVSFGPAGSTTGTYSGGAGLTQEQAQAACAAAIAATPTTLASFPFSVTVGTNNDKSGYSLSPAGLDAIATTPAANGVTPNFPQMVIGTWRRWFRKHVASGSTLTGYADDGTTALTVQSIPAVASDQTQGASA